MAALPETNITVSLVKNAIGESTTDVGALVTSYNVNRWGFNSPDEGQNTKNWGVFDRLPPFQLGCFRGYDHNWACYGMSEPTISELLSYYEAGSIDINLFYFPAQAAAPTVPHLFDVYFSRTGDFTHSSHVQILDDAVINNAGFLTIPLYPLTPPDGGTPLAENSTVYFKVKHVSSPTRRWDKNQINFDPGVMVMDIEDDAYIVTVNLGSDVFSYNTTFQKQPGAELEAFRGRPNGIMQLDVSIKNGNKTSVSVELSININNQSNFLGSLSETVTQSFIVPAATRSGGALILGTLDTMIYGVANLSKWPANTPFYGRARINSCSDGTFSTGWQVGLDGVLA